MSEVQRFRDPGPRRRQYAMFWIGGLFSAPHSLTFAQIQPTLRHQLLLVGTLADCQVNEKNKQRYKELYCVCSQINLAGSICIRTVIKKKLQGELTRSEQMHMSVLV